MYMFCIRIIALEKPGNISLNVSNLNEAEMLMQVEFGLAVGAWGKSIILRRDPQQLLGKVPVLRAKMAGPKTTKLIQLPPKTSFSGSFEPYRGTTTYIYR